jgi:hypothetical protein
MSIDVASFVKVVVLELNQGESVAKLPPLGSLLGLYLAYHFLAKKYSQKQTDFTEKCGGIFPPVYCGKVLTKLRNEGK